MKEILLATSNKGKIAELTNLLSPIHCISQHSLNIEDAEETGLSFIENAIIKARHASRLANMPALADDSGLIVSALNGEPGIYSARYAGRNSTDDKNIDLLLTNLERIANKSRDAYFYCAIALVQHAEDPAPLIAIGRLDGKIGMERRGEHGFGYDPIFYLPSHNCTLAELSPKMKNTISHRAIALKQLSTLLHR